MRQQIAQLPEAVRLAEEAAATPAATTADPMLDLHLDFKSETQLLPVLSGSPSVEQARQLGCLQALFAAVPWGAPLPTVDFKNLGAHLHSSTACWGTPCGWTAGRSGKGTSR